MKKLLVLSLCFASISSHAVIITFASSTYVPGCVEIAARIYDTKYDPNALSAGVVSCGISTTTSLPTMIIEGQELALDSEEASIRLVAEANGNAEALISSIIAQDLKIEVESVFNEVNQMEASGEEINVKNLVENLTR